MLTQKRKRLSLLSYLLTLTIVLNAFMPMGISYAAEHGEDKISNKEITLSQGGTVLGDNATVDPSKPIEVQMSFSVPVKGQDENGIAKGDTLQFKIAEGFKLLESYTQIPMEGEKLGLVDITQTGNEPIMGLITFNGDDKYFADDVSVGNIKLSFSMQAGESNSGGSGGDYQITVLGKTFTFKKPEPKYVMKIEKSGIFVDGTVQKQIEWTVNLRAFEQNSGQNISLKDYVFSDQLSDSIGSYVPNSFAITSKDGAPIDINTASTLEHNDTEKLLKYTFAQDLDGQVTIKFKTELMDGNYFTNVSRTIENTAKLTNPDGEIAEAKARVEFKPGWIKKYTGVVWQNSKHDPENTVNPIHIGKNRSITWVVEINPMKTALGKVVLTDVLQSAKGLNQKNPEVTLWVDVTSLNSEGRPILKSNNEEPAKGYPTTGTKVNKVFTMDSSGVVNLGDLGADDQTKNKTVYVVINTEVDDKLSLIAEQDVFANKAKILIDDKYTFESNEAKAYVGHAAIVKSAPEFKERTGGNAQSSVSDGKIQWNIRYNQRGQKVEEATLMDLFVHGNAYLAYADLDFSGVPANLLTHIETNFFGSKKGYQRLFQKYDGAFANADGVVGTHYPLKKGEEVVADLLVITNIPQDKETNITFYTKFLEPKVVLGTKVDGDGKPNYYISNYVLFFNKDGFLSHASSWPQYFPNYLKKEVLKAQDYGTDVNNINVASTGDANNAFNYKDNSVIYRISLNAEGIDFTTREIFKDGKVQAANINFTLQEVLPAGWEFVDFAENTPFLLYEGSPNDKDAKVTAGNLIDPTSGYSDIFTFNATEKKFEFKPFKKPYVLLVKAKPSNATLENYLKQNKLIPATNTVWLTSSEFGLNVSDKQEVKLRTEVLKKDGLSNEDGEVTWTVDFTPSILKLTTEEGETLKLVDTLDDNLGARRLANGKLDFSNNNFEVYKLSIKTDGKYEAEKLVITTNEKGEGIFEDGAAKGKISYQTIGRKIVFEIPNANQAYRFVYTTDVLSTTAASVKNKVQLFRSKKDDTVIYEAFKVLTAKASADTERAGIFTITKEDEKGVKLPGAEFTLYTKTENPKDRVELMAGVTDTNGKLTFRFIPVGEYVLVETKTPKVGDKTYNREYKEFEVVVKKEGSSVVTEIRRGATLYGKGSVKIKNIETSGVSKLVLMKRVNEYVEGNPSFTFEIDFNDKTTRQYKYYGINGAPDGEIVSKGRVTLSHKQSIEFENLPIGTEVTITEIGATGYTTTITKTIGDATEVINGTVVKFTTEKGKTHTAEYLNSKPKPIVPPPPVDPPLTPTDPPSPVRPDPPPPPTTDIPEGSVPLSPADDDPTPPDESIDDNNVPKGGVDKDGKIKSAPKTSAPASAIFDLATRSILLYGTMSLFAANAMEVFKTRRLEDEE